MAATAHVHIIESSSGENWENAILEGVLRSRGIAVSKMSPNAPCIGSKRDIAVYLPSSSQDLDLLENLRVAELPTIIGGRYLSSDNTGFKPNTSHVFILGEPYGFVARFALEPQRLSGLLGGTYVGPLIYPCGISFAGVEHPSNPFFPVLTSLGCEKRCAYCPYGSVHSEIHGTSFARRERAWEEVCQDCEDACQTGKKGILFVADQVVSNRTEDNSELFSLAENITVTRPQKMPITFNISPKAVINNLELLCILADRFDLRPTLSLDSLDEESLEIFDVDFNASDALLAIRMLVELGLHFRVNYIFAHPWKTDTGLMCELRTLEYVGGLLAYLPPEWQFMIGGDILLSEFRFLAGAPLARSYPKDKWSEWELSPACVAALQAAAGALEDEARHPGVRSNFLQKLFQISLRAAVRN